jgi:hypothetical protein
MAQFGNPLITTIAKINLARAKMYGLGNMSAKLLLCRMIALHTTINVQKAVAVTLIWNKLELTLALMTMQLKAQLAKPVTVSKIAVDSIATFMKALVGAQRMEMMLLKVMAGANDGLKLIT